MAKIISLYVMTFSLYTVCVCLVLLVSLLYALKIYIKHEGSY